MSFVFPKPVLTAESRNSSSYSNYSHFDLDKNHNNPEPDYDELLVRLSLYAFNRLSPSDQREKIEEISHAVNVEDVQFLEESDEAFRLRTFAELFKKLPFSDQLKVFLSKVIQKFKRERQFGELISSFKQLDAEHQQQLIEKIVHGEPENLRNPGETEEEFRLRRFTQLSRDYTHHVYKRLVAWKDRKVASENENGSNWKSCFAEFFLNFSVIWFQGQSARGQDMLIEQLDEGTRGVVIGKHLQDESEEDFKLRRFTELCKNVVDFRVQEKFFDKAERKLEQWGNNVSLRMITEPQDSDSAAELLVSLWTFGVRLLSAKDQQQKIDDMSNQVKSGVKTERPLAAAAEDQTITTDDQEAAAMRIRRLTELFNQVPVRSRIYLFKELRNTLLKGKRYSTEVRVFRGLSAKYQTEIIENMFNQITETRWFKVNPAKFIVEKFSGESEEDFRFKRFIKMCHEHPSIWEHIVRPEAYRVQLHSASDPYDEFLFGVANIWFKAKCANTRRNPIQLILFGQVEFGDTIEKLAEESEDDFRLRRFAGSFKRLEFTSQECILDYIEDTMSTYLTKDLDISGSAIHYELTDPRDPGQGTSQQSVRRFAK